MIHCAVGTDCDVFWTAWGEMGGEMSETVKEDEVF